MRAAGLAIAIILLLAGCAANPNPNTSTEEVAMPASITEAKTELWAVEDVLAGYIPAEIVTETWPRQEFSTVLFECADPGSYTWPGSLEVGITSEADARPILSAIEDDWLLKPEWAVAWRETAGGNRYLELLRDDGLRFSISYLSGKEALSIGSFSACFPMPDYDPLARSY